MFFVPKVVDCRICGDPNSALRFGFVEFSDNGKLLKLLCWQWTYRCLCLTLTFFLILTCVQKVQQMLWVLQGQCLVPTLSRCSLRELRLHLLTITFCRGLVVWFIIFIYWLWSSDTCVQLEIRKCEVQCVLI